MPKTRINISIDHYLADFAKVFSPDNRTSVAETAPQYLLSMKRGIDGEKYQHILSHPAFQEAMESAQKRVQQGSALWHSYDEIFND